MQRSEQASDTESEKSYSKVPAITTQPGAVVDEIGEEFAPPPAYDANQVASRGLEFLAATDKITVQQRKEMAEIITGWECQNRYVLRNGNGDQVYYAVEESSALARIACKAARPYVIHIVDNCNKEVMRFVREMQCCAGCYCLASTCDSCGFHSEIEAPPGNVIATVKQRSSCAVTNLTVLDRRGREVFEIDGCTWCEMHCSCDDKIFTIYNMAGEDVGTITKKWGGCCKECWTDADTFSVFFGQNTEVNMKAALLGATFLLDFMEFEQRQQ